MNTDTIIQWVQANWPTILAVLTALGTLLHTMGYNVPLLSAIIALLQKLSPKAATPPANVIGGAGGPGVNPDSAVLTDAVANRHGLPHDHPLIQAAVKAALADLPTLLSLFMTAAPLLMAPKPQEVPK